MCFLDKSLADLFAKVDKCGYLDEEEEEEEELPPEEDEEDEEEEEVKRRERRGGRMKVEIERRGGIKK